MVDQISFVTTQPTDTFAGIALPDARGYFGAYGGRFVPETLVPALDELTAEYVKIRHDAEFQRELADLHRTYTGRPFLR